MKNIFINNYRKESKIIVINDSTDNNGFIDATKYKMAKDTPESLMSQKEIIRMVSQLPENIRATFTLYLKGYAYQEIAELQNVPIGTVKSRIFIAKKRLQKNLADFR